MSFFRASIAALALVVCSLTVVAQESDLGVMKTGPDSAAAGDNVTYNITYINAGPEDSPFASLTDTIPAGLEFVSLAAPPEFTCMTPVVGSGGTITCTASPLVAGANLNFTLVLKVPDQTPPGTTFTNVAMASGGETFDPNEENNSSTWSFTTSGAPLADLQILKSGQSSAGPNSDVPFVITVTNNGPTAATAVSFSDPLPAGMTFVSFSQTNGPTFTCMTPTVGSNGPVNCSIASLGNGVSATFTLTVHVGEGSAEHTNQVTVTAETADPNPENDSSVAVVTVTSADVAIAKTGPGSATAGDMISWTLLASNAGPDPAANVVISDALPSGTTFVSIEQATGPTATCLTPAVGANGLVTCNIVSLLVGDPATLVITARVNPNVPAGSQISNTATIATQSGDTNSENNSSTSSSSVATSADISVVKSDSPDPVAAGANLTYTITLTNVGISDAQNLSLSDTVPANTTFVSFSAPAGWSSLTPAVGGTGTVTSTASTLASGASAQFILVVKVNQETPHNSALTNTASGTTSTSDPNPGNNNSTATTTVSNLADLSVTKTDSPDPVTAGTNLTYTITVTNNGANDAQSVSLSDTLPANTTLASFTVPAGWTRTDAVPVGGTGTVTATRPTLASGANSVFTLVVNVNIATPHGTVLSNTASVSSTTSDPNSANNSSTATSSVLSLPVANDDQYFMSKDQVLNANAPGVLINDTGSSLSAVPVVGGTTAAGGTYTLNANGSFTYTPPAGFSGSDGFDYTVTNPAGSDTGHVEITVTDPATISLRISEFRFNGPSGSTDEFFEIFNASPTAHQVGGTSLSHNGGYGLFASAGNGVTSNTVTLICQIPNGTIIPARGYVLCTGSGYSLAALGAVGSSTGSAIIPVINGAASTSAGNFPVTNGTVANPGAFSSADVPNDAGLLLANVGANTVGASSDTGNRTFGFNATGVAAGAFSVFDRVGFAPYGSGAPLQPCQLANTAGCGVSGSARPSLADNYCESNAAQCLRPVGDASTTNHGPQPFYGDSGQYSLLRRQTTDQSVTIGTSPQDTANNSDDILMVSPVPAINIAFSHTNFPTGTSNGLLSVLGAAGPQNNAAPADLPESSLQSSLFDSSRTASQTPNSERRYVIDNTNTTINNNPMGSFIFRFGFRNMSAASDINRLRFRVDNLSVPCGQPSPSAATALVGSGDARNLSQTSPNCQGFDNKTAVLKMLNMPTELVAPENGPVVTVRGSVIEDTDGTKLAPNGGGVNNSLVRTGTTPGSLTGEFTTVVPAGSPGPKFIIGFRMGVVKGGSFRFLFQPEGSSANPLPSPTVAP